MGTFSEAELLSALPLFETKFEKSDGCWEWRAGRTRGGYGGFAVCRRHIGAHRYAYCVYVGAIPYGLRVLHRCDNPPCVRPSHLFLGTDKDNVHDCAAKGRRGTLRGEDAVKAKLAADQVLEIRRLIKLGVARKEISAKFGISRSNISHIKMGRSWRHLSP